MAWRDNLRPASFRGVPFEVDTSSLTVGRRLARHEYPQRDIPFMEDMGRKAREYKVDALILGPDYMDDRDALIAAIEAAGAGQLVHPYYGTLQVVVTGECQISESTESGGRAKIAITFLEAGLPQEPEMASDTEAVLEAQYDACEDAIAADFAESFSIDGLPDFAVQDALGSVNAALALPSMALGNLAWIRADPLSALTALLPENLLSSLGNPLGLARGVLYLVRNAAEVLVLLAFDRPPVMVSASTPSRQAQNANRAAIAGLVRQAATARRIMDLAKAEPATLDDARTYRSEIVSRTDDVLLTETTGQASADALVQLRTDAVAHFAAITPSLPRLTRLVPRAVRPALVLAHDFYGDGWFTAGREDELIARNRVRHPGFVPAGQGIFLVT